MKGRQTIQGKECSHATRQQLHPACSHGCRSFSMMKLPILPWSPSPVHHHHLGVSRHGCSSSPGLSPPPPVPTGSLLLLSSPRLVAVYTTTMVVMDRIQIIKGKPFNYPGASFPARAPVGVIYSFSNNEEDSATFFCLRLVMNNDCNWRKRDDGQFIKSGIIITIGTIITTILTTIVYLCACAWWWETRSW